MLLDAVVLGADGKQRVSASGESSPQDAEDLGNQVADNLLRQGAAELIAGSRMLLPE